MHSYLRLLIYCCVVYYLLQLHPCIFTCSFSCCLSRQVDERRGNVEFVKKKCKSKIGCPDSERVKTGLAAPLKKLWASFRSSLRENASLQVTRMDFTDCSIQIYNNFPVISPAVFQQTFKNQHRLRFTGGRLICTRKKMKYHVWNFYLYLKIIKNLVKRWTFLFIIASFGV